MMVICQLVGNGYGWDDWCSGAIQAFDGEGGGANVPVKGLAAVVDEGEGYVVRGIIEDI